MADPKLYNDFSRGANNIAQVDSLPDGAVRLLTNFDPVVGGGLQLRAGYTLQESLVGVRGGIAAGNDIIVVAADIRRFSPQIGYSVVLGAAPAGDVVVGAELNGDVFLQVGVTQLKVRGSTVAPWAMPEFGVDIDIETGSLVAGVYRVAVTAVDAFGAESGATPYILTLPADKSLALSWIPPAGATHCKVYVSAADGETLYFQDQATDAFVIHTVRDDLERMTTVNLQPPPLADHIAAYKGRLLLAAGKTLWFTEPFAPHLVNYIDGHVSYGEEIVMIQPVDGGVFLATETKTYFLTSLGLPEANQPTVAEHGAVRGSQVLLPDGRATWLTQYGQAFGSASGALELPQRGSYAPATASAASAGVVKNNGVEMVVNNLRGAIDRNPLGVYDSFDLEIE